jgi:hypothetical protein
VAAWGVGALLGSAAVFRLADREPLALIRRAAVVQALPLWLLALELPPAVAAAALLASGLANPLVTAPFITLATVGVPEALRARVMLAFLTASTAAGGLGLAITGPLADALGVRAVLLGRGRRRDAGRHGLRPGHARAVRCASARVAARRARRPSATAAAPTAGRARAGRRGR